MTLLSSALKKDSKVNYWREDILSDSPVRGQYFTILVKAKHQTLDLFNLIPSEASEWSFVKE